MRTHFKMPKGGYMIQLAKDKAMAQCYNVPTGHKCTRGYKHPTPQIVNAKVDRYTWNQLCIDCCTVDWIEMGTYILLPLVKVSIGFGTKAWQYYDKLVEVSSGFRTKAWQYYDKSKGWI